MKIKSYDQFELNTAIDYLKRNPFESKVKLENYLKKYPNDYYSYSFYIYSLIILGEFDNAKRILDYLESIQYIDRKFLLFIKKNKYLKNRLIFNYLKLLIYQGKYSESYSFYTNYPLEIKEINSAIFYCKCRLGMVNFNTRKNLFYLHRQIIKYDEDDFLYHIREHSYDYNTTLNNPNSNIFNSCFLITQVIEAIKSFIPSSKRLFTGFFEDSYYFKYDSCGTVNNKKANFIKVICFHDTDNIITMFPCMNIEELPYIDLNYLNKTDNKESIKIRKLSQIDKFNKRYNL